MTTISEAQLQANRANAQHSTGPRTETGKSRSRLNATRHGLTGQFFVLSEEDRHAYDTFEQGMLAGLKPEGTEENQLAVSIAQDHWRINRSRAIEFNSLGIGHGELVDDVNANSPEVQAAIAQAQTWRREPQYFATIALYEHRLNRTIARNKKDLAELQTRRLETERQARREAELLLRQAYRRQEMVDTGAPIQVNGSAKSGLIATSVLQQASIQVNGFVYSVPELITSINRAVNLKEAAFYEKYGWKTTLPYPCEDERLPLAA